VKTERKRVKDAVFEALEETVNADDGTGYPQLKAEVEDFLADDEERATKLGLHAGDRVSSVRLKQAVAQLYGRFEESSSKDVSIVTRLSFTPEDAFDPAKVQQAFAQTTDAQIYRIPEGISKRTQYAPSPVRESVMQQHIEAPRASYVGNRVSTTYPNTEALPVNLAVVVWEVKSGGWVVVTPSGDRYVVPPLKPDRRGAEGAIWIMDQTNFLTPKSAKFLASKGHLAKAKGLKIQKLYDAVLNCNSRVIKSTLAKIKKVKNSNADPDVRSEKLAKIQKAKMAKLAKSCDRKKSAYEAGLAALATSWKDTRARLLKTIVNERAR